MEQISGTGRRLDTAIHFTMAACGGFFGVYAILSRMGNFGQAQTANLIELICGVLGRDLTEVCARLLAALIFIAGMVLATVLEKKAGRDLRYLAISFDMAAAVWIGLIPAEADPVAALYPVFFATAFQWCVFKGANGYVSATIFCTNNLKQTVVSATEYLLMAGDSRERQEKRARACFFGGTFGSFYAGAAVGGLLWYAFGIRSIWFNIGFLLAGAGLVSADRAQRRKAERGKA